MGIAIQRAALYHLVSNTSNESDFHLNTKSSPEISSNFHSEIQVERNALHHSKSHIGFSTKWIFMKCLCFILSSLTFRIYIYTDLLTGLCFASPLFHRRFSQCFQGTLVGTEFWCGLHHQKVLPNRKASISYLASRAPRMESHAVGLKPSTSFYHEKNAEENNNRARLEVEFRGFKVHLKTNLNWVSSFTYRLTCKQLVILSIAWCDSLQTRLFWATHMSNKMRVTEIEHINQGTKRTQTHSARFQQTKNILERN